MNTRNQPKTGNVVRGNAYSSLRYQPRNIFCMGTELTDRLDEFLWNREHEKALNRKPQAPQPTPQQRINMHLNVVREVQKKRHDNALDLIGN